MMDLDLVSALADRDRIRRDGWRPGAAELDGAPLIDDYEWGLDACDPSVVVVIGSIDGGEIVATPALVEVDRENRKWVRTVTGWFRLGRPRGEGVQ